MIQAKKARVGTFYLLLDIFFDYFKAMPKQTHRKELITLQILPSLNEYAINTTAIDLQKANQTTQLNIT